MDRLITSLKLLNMHATFRRSTGTVSRNPSTSICTTRSLRSTILDNLVHTECITGFNARWHRKVYVHECPAKSKRTGLCFSCDTIGLVQRMCFPTFPTLPEMPDGWLKVAGLLYSSKNQRLLPWANLAGVGDVLALIAFLTHCRNHFNEATSLGLHLHVVMLTATDENTLPHKYLVNCIVS